MHYRSGNGYSRSPLSNFKKTPYVRLGSGTLRYPPILNDAEYANLLDVLEKSKNDPKRIERMIRAEENASKMKTYGLIENHGC